MAIDITKTITDVPIIDELVYYAKIMALETIIKDEDDALVYETFDIIKESDLYIACIDGRATFLMFDDNTYTIDMIISVDLQPVDIREACTLNKNLVPQQYRSALTEMAVVNYISTYEEKNNYYRMLNGIPNIEDTTVYPTKFNQSWEPGIYIKEYDNIPDEIDLTIPIHKYDKFIIELLKNLGVLTAVMLDYPTKKYLNYLGDKSISVYNARTADRFAILYVPSVDIVELYHNFSNSLERNRVYVTKVIYNEAFKLESNYYNKFIIILIILQSVVDTIISAPEYLIRRDVFDLRTIRYIFEGYNIDYFKEIPLKYQIAMVKNLNKLLKYKSTTKNLIDICTLFGFEDVNIFKYYLLKDRKKDIDGNFLYNYKEIQDPEYPDDPAKTITVEDTDENYDLKFFKTPIDSDMETYIKNSMNFISYDDITLQDPYWDGDRTHEEVKSDIINREFNILRSKYVSIDNVYHLTNLSFERPYFFSMLFEEDRKADALRITVPYISITKRFRFTDIICFLYALMYEYYGIVDSISDTTTKIMAIKGFNFKADLALLAQYLSDNNTSMAELGMPEFIIPEGSILTFGQLLEIFTNNKQIYDFLETQLYNVKDYNMYCIYKTIYNSLMIKDENLEFFRKSDMSLAVSYSDFLSDRDVMLYDKIQEIKIISFPDQKQTTLINMIGYTIESIDEYIDTDEYKHLFSNMPTESAIAIQKYIYKVINFFKSYKIDIFNINNIYKLDDGSGILNIIDKMFINTVFTKFEVPMYHDNYSKIMSTMTPNETIMFIEVLSKYVDMTYEEQIQLIGTINTMQTSLSYIDLSIFNEVFTSKTSIIFSDSLDIVDKLWIDIRFFEVLTNYISLTYEEQVQLTETINGMQVDLNYADVSIFNEVFTPTISISFDDRVDIIDKLWTESVWVEFLSKYVNLTYEEQIQLTESINEIQVDLNCIDVSIFNEVFAPRTSISFNDRLDIVDKLWIERV